jgi:hypothetical protein
MSISINGKKYLLNKKYVMSPLMWTPELVKSAVESVSGVNIPDKYFHEKMDTTRKQSIKAFFKNIEDVFDYYYDGELQDLKQYHKYTNDIRTSANAVEKLDDIIVIFRSRFEWPAGYFYDEGSCWHTYNFGAPLLLEKMGAVWMTGFKNNNGKKGEPLFRVAVMPDGTWSKNTIIHSMYGLNKYNLYNIPSYLNNGKPYYMATFGNDASTHNVLYFSCVVIENEKIKDNDTGVSSKVTLSKYGVNIKINEKDKKYKPKSSCEKCQCNILDNEIYPHTCGYTRVPNTRIYKRANKGY